MRPSVPAAVQVAAVLQPSVVVPVASATLPAPAAIAIGVASTTSVAGRGAPTAAFDASWMSRYLPGWIVPESSVSCVGGGAEVSRAGGARVLDGHAVQNDGCRAAVEELDEIVCERGAGVAAASVDLADDNAVARGETACRSSQRQQRPDHYGQTQTKIRHPFPSPRLVLRHIQ